MSLTVILCWIAGVFIGLYIGYLAIILFRILRYVEKTEKKKLDLMNRMD